MKELFTSDDFLKAFEGYCWPVDGCNPLKECARVANTKLEWHLADMNHEIEKQWREKEARLTNAACEAEKLLQLAVGDERALAPIKNWLKKYGKGPKG